MFLKSLGFIKKSTLIAFVLILTLISSMVPSIQVFAATDVVVNLSKQYQTIKGFGGMNHPLWISDLTPAQRDTAFGNGANQLGFSILRIHVDENKNNWSRELATAKAAIAKGAIVFATPWNPPSYMTEPAYVNGKQVKRLKYSQYGAYANYLNEFVTYMKNNGVNLYAISIQNEPDYGYEWTWWTADEIYNFTKNYAGKINCRVMSAESFSYNKSYYDKILKDPSALANIDIVGTHFYGTPVQAMPYPLFQQKGAGKELWMTEVYVPNSTSDADKWPEAVDVSYNMHSALINGFQSYVWWYIRRSYGPMKENGNISKRGYCMAQYSKFVRPGYKRVDATANPNTNVYVSAYQGNNQVVIVAINKGSSEYVQKFNVNNGTIKTVDRYRTTGSENLAKTANMALSGNGFFATLPANSVSTFVCSLNGSTTDTGNSGNINNGNTNTSVTVPGETANLQDGWYYIKNVNAQKYLQVTNNTGKAAQNVELRTGTGVAGQKWYLKNVGNGYVTLTSALGNFMLDIASAKNTDGANVQIYDAHSGTAQQFMLKTTSTNGAYVVATKCSNLTKVLDDYNFGTSDGTNVCQWSYGGKNNQLWVFESTNNTTSAGSNTNTGNNSNTGSNTNTPAATGKLSAEYSVSNWGGAYQVSFKINNKSNADVNSWTLKLKKSEVNVSSSWNVKVKEEGEYIVITPESFNSYIAKGGSVEFGFQGKGTCPNTLSYILN